MSTSPRQRTAAEVSGASAIKLDVQLRKLFHRPHLIRLLLGVREQASLAALTSRERDKAGFFARDIGTDVLAKGREVLQRRIDRFNEASVFVATEADAVPPEAPIWDRTNYVDEFRAARDAGLAQFMLACARLFDPSIVTARISAETLLQMPLKAFGEFVAELNSRPNAPSWLIECAAALLVYVPGAGNTAVRRMRAQMLLDSTAFPEDVIDSLRWMADAYWLLARRRDEFAALQMIAMLGDWRFVASRYERLDLPTTLALVPLEPATLSWKDGRFNPTEDVVYDADLVVVDGMLPSVMLNMLPKHALFTPRSLVRRQWGRSGLVAKFCGAYSIGESILSLRTEQLGQRMCRAFARPFEGTELDALVPLLQEASIRVDDVLFNALLPLFAFNAALTSVRPKSIALITDQLSFANQAALAASGLLPGCSVDACVLRPGDGVSEDAGAEDPKSLDSLVDDTIRFLQTQGVHADAIENDPVQPVATSTLFCGRPFDRNYIADLKAFSPLATAAGETHLMVTGPARVKDGHLPTLTEVMPESRTLVVWDNAEKLSRTLAGRAIPESLKDHGANVVSAFLDDQDEPLADLLVAAEPQLRRLMERSLPAMIASAALVRKTVRAASPARVVCLPGRDWLSRMAVKDAHLRFGDAVRSFDVQTVFIGPRLRYKPTTCDTQVAIETHSASIFRQSFGLPDSRIMIGGSPRYAASLKAGRIELRNRVDEQPFTILFTSSPILDRCLPVIRVLVEFLRSSPAPILHVRPHPSSNAQDVAEIRECVAQLDARGTVEASSTLAAAFARADVVVTRFSNTGLEAAMLGKDVIAADFVNEPPPVPLGAMGVAIGVHSPATLVAALSDVLLRGPLSARLNLDRAAYFEKNRQLLNEHAAAALWDAIRREPLAAPVDR